MIADPSRGIYIYVCRLEDGPTAIYLCLGSPMEGGLIR